MSTHQAEALKELGRALVDQHAARTVVPPAVPRSGYWFGGGNMVQAADESLYLCGRYRNAGDSTTGLARGERGVELAVFSSDDGGATFRKVLSYDKPRLNLPGREVLSIEGSALHVTDDGVELYVSTEKNGVPYPEGVKHFQKPGTGVWSIDVLRAGSFEELVSAPVEPLVEAHDPQYLHVKDPSIYRTEAGDTVMVFCTHPFSWSSSNAAYCVRSAGAGTFGTPDFHFFPRGFTWDVSVSRISNVLSLDGALFGRTGGGVDRTPGTVQLVFYDGAECLRPHEENPAAVSRPRGFSCEEIAGLAMFADDRIAEISRLSTLLPEYTSPWGTGSCRYIHTLTTDDGIHVTWQQAQPDGSQPLVINFLPWARVREILSA